MIASVVSNSQFVAQINPSTESVFPWLSQIAGAYEKYTVNSIGFEYVPSCSTLADGILYLAFDHDPSDVLTNDFSPQTLT